MTKLDYVRNALTRMVADGEKSRDSIARRLNEGGAVYMLEWIGTDLEAEDLGRLAGETLVLFNDMDNRDELDPAHIDEVATRYERRASDETGYIILTNTQMDLIGKLARIKAFRKVAEIIRFACTGDEA